MRTSLNTFHNMKYRCYNPNDKRFMFYGGKGITICDKWLRNPVSFVTWSEENGWAPGKQIHRKDNSMGYSPDNCEWLTHDEHLRRHPCRLGYKFRRENVIPTHTCTRCGHAWGARKPGRPVICPHCKSPYHDKPRVNKLSPGKSYGRHDLENTQV